MSSMALMLKATLNGLAHPQNRDLYQFKETCILYNGALAITTEDESKQEITQMKMKEDRF